MTLRDNEIFVDTKSISDFLRLPANIGDAYTASAVTASRLDLGRIVRMNNGSANTFTIPPDSAVLFDIGESITLRQTGAGLTTLVAGTGVTITSLNSLLASAGQYAFFGVIKESANTWNAYGSLA